MKSNVVLIGMPGCGKSTIGVLAAKALCKSFVDTDLLIQASEGAALQEIINQHGSEYFAKVEEKILCGFSEQNCVVATGGSAVYYKEAMNHLSEDANVVFLRIRYDTMIHRLRNIETRGILLKPGETLEKMFVNRSVLYEKYADIVIDCDCHEVEETVSAVCNSVGKRTSI